jgi:hypothetical protein
MDREEQLRIYWERRKNCEKGKHKLRDNSFGITWCVTCGFLSNKPAPIGIFINSNRLEEVDKLIYPHKIL